MRERLDCGTAGPGILSARNKFKKRQMSMQLHIMSGCSSAQGHCLMDEAVWSRLPEDIVIWEVLRFVPAAKRVQLQSVSRKWRKVLKSTKFYDALVLNSAARGGAERESEVGVDAFVTRTPLYYGDRDYDYKSSSSGWPISKVRVVGMDWSSFLPASSREVKVVDIDLRFFVPNSFWAPNGRRYQVVAAADGLVCISNIKPGEFWGYPRYCVLNPLSRTCTVLPQVPFLPARWLSLTTGAVTMCLHASGTCKVATYDLATGGGGDWVVAEHESPTYASADTVTVAMCGGKIYVCASQLKISYLDLNRLGWGSPPSLPQVLVRAAAEAETATAIDAPSVMVSLLHQDASCFTTAKYGVGLVTHRGALFYVAQLMRWNGDPLDSLGALAPVVCGVWRLARDGTTWAAVARLELDEVHRLAGLRYAASTTRYQLRFDGDDHFQPRPFGDDFVRFRGYGLRQLLCCSLVNVHVETSEGDSGGDGCRRSARRLLLVLAIGFNVDTAQWELVQELEQASKYEAVNVVSAAVQLRPDLCLTS